MRDVTCYVGVGSNIDPEVNVPAALAVLVEAPDTRLTGISTFYRTRPIGAPGTPDFYNGVVAVRTSRSATELSALLASIEAARGRRPAADRHAPRTIDLDLLVYGDPDAEGPDAPPPHPDIVTRAFVALPLLELAPGLIFPDGAGTLAELCRRFDGQAGEPLTDFTDSLRRQLLP